MFIKLDKEKIDQIIEDSKEEYEITLNIYAYLFDSSSVLPNWETVKTVGSLPTINKETNLYIHNAIQKKFPNIVFGYWFNSGFGSLGGDDLIDFQVSIETELIEIS